MGWGNEGNGCLIKNNMSRDDGVVGREIKALITFVINGVSEENTMSGPGGQFVGSLGREVGIANTV
jgi:hypothetical protein